MSKRSSAFQGSKEDPGIDRDGPEDTAKKASSATMSGRKIINPKSRKRPGTGGGDLSALGNPFGSIDPNVNGGTASPAANNANPFSSINFGNNNNTQSQSFPAPSFGSNNQNSAPQNSSFPPSQNPTSNIFGNMNGGSGAFTFGGSNNVASNPFSQPPQPSPASTPRFNFSQPSQTQQSSPSIFGQPQSGNQTQTNGANLFAQPSTPSETNNTQPSQSTSPNDMDMASPPSSNKFSNPLGGIGQASSTASNAGTPATSNIFGNLNNSSTPSLFANTANNTPKPAENPFAPSGSNLFGNLNNQTNQASSSPAPSANLFSNPKPTTSDAMSPSVPSGNPFANISASKLNDSASASTPSGNLFAGLTANKPSATHTQTPSSLFPSSSTAQQPSANEPSTPPARSDLFASAPKTSENLFGQPRNQAFGQKAPQTAPPKASTGGGLETGGPPGGFAQSQTQQAEPSRKLDFGAAPGASSQPTSSSQPSGAETQVYARMNSNIRNAVLSLDPTADWSETLTAFVDAYRSSLQKERAAQGQSQAQGAGSLFGAKRKEQADAPEEAPRASKISNTASTPPVSTLEKEQSSTSKKFQSILGGTNSSTQDDTGGSEGKLSTPRNSNLFGQPPASTNNLQSKLGPPQSNNLFGQSQKNTNLFGASNGSNPGLFSQSSSKETASGTKPPTETNIFAHFADKGQPAEDEDPESEDDETIENALHNKSPAPEKSNTDLFKRITGGPPRRFPSPESTASAEETAANGTYGHVTPDAQPKAAEGDHTWNEKQPINFGDSVNSASLPKPNSNIFGSSKTSSNLFGFPSSTPAGSPSKAGEGSNLFGSSLKQSTADAPSRATTPGTEVNGAPSSEKGQESSAQENEETNGEVSSDKTALSAEELKTEDVLFEVPKLRMMQYMSEVEGSAQKWVARGTGPFRVMKNKNTGKVRMVHRIAPNGKVLINSPLAKTAQFTKIGGKGMLAVGGMGLLAPSKGGDRDKSMHFQTWTARMASDETAKDLLKVLQDNKEA